MFLGMISHFSYITDQRQFLGMISHFSYITDPKAVPRNDISL